MNSETSRETIEFVVRSECRVTLLETLLEDGPVARDSLRDRLDVVRTTLGRNLEAFEDRALIRRDGRTCELTRTGELVAAETLDLLETTDLASRIHPVVRRLPNDEFDVDIRALEDATVVESTMADPYAPAVAHARTMSESDRAKLLLPATGADQLESAVEDVADGAVHEIVLTDDLAAAMQTNPDLEDGFEALAESDDVSIYRYDGDYSYFVGVLDDVVQIGVHDDRGIPAALLESEADELRRWAEDRFESYRDASERIA